MPAGWRTTDGRNMKELQEKQNRVKEFLAREGFDGILLSRCDNFAWFTGGRDSHISIASEAGSGSLLVTAERTYLIASSIEMPRLCDEEIGGLGFQTEEFPWYEDKRNEILKKLCSGKKVCSDDGAFGTKNVNEKFAPLRYALTEEEIRRYAWLGKHAAVALENVCRDIKPGSTEHEFAAKLASNVLGEGMIPIVLLVAADERIKKYRHPIPTDRKIKKYVMGVLCAKKWGLIASLTRIVHFGRMDEELRNKHNAVIRVDASLILNTRPGARLCDIFNEAARVYEECGFPGEWTRHHQGGPTGYSARDFKGSPTEVRTVLLNQAFAWNPSIAGTKSEDTIVVLEDRNRVITQTSGWPMLTVKYKSKSVRRPDILVRK
jgi:Xaa-Pro aminopeptidase